MDKILWLQSDSEEELLLVCSVEKLRLLKKHKQYELKKMITECLEATFYNDLLPL